VETSFEVQGAAMWAELGVQISIAFWDALRERHIGTAREELGAEGDAAWEEGLQLPFDAAVELALLSG
jgi:hypothetical protein